MHLHVVHCIALLSFIVYGIWGTLPDLWWCGLSNIIKTKRDEIGRSRNSSIGYDPLQENLFALSDSCLEGGKGQ